MAFQVLNYAGAPPITQVDTSAKVPLGTRVKGKDATYGEAEFIYLLGVTSQVVGNLVTFNATTFQTALSANTAGTGSAFAVAMAATTATKKYGWYQVTGLATIKKTNVSWEPQKAVYQSATTGRVMDTVASGKQVAGAVSANLTTVTTTTSTILVMLNAPHNTGVII